MEKLTRGEFEILYDIHYETLVPSDKPDWIIIKSLENKGLIMQIHEEGKVIAYTETVYGAELINGWDYDDWATELRYQRLHDKKKNWRA